MNTKELKYWSGYFLVVMILSLLLLLVSGSLGALLFDVTIGHMHASDDIIRVAIDGGIATIMIAYPAPIVFAGVTTFYIKQIEDDQNESTKI